MSNRVNAAGKLDRVANGDVPETMLGAETVECYEDDEGTVFYDAENPLAWIETDTAVDIKETV